MKNASAHIANIRALIKEFTRDEPYTDQFLYEVLSVSRANIIKQRLDNFKKISSDNWFRICIELEQTKSHNCSCVPAYLNCLVLRTKYKIPQVFSNRNKERIELSLLSGTNINLVGEADWLRIKDNEFKAQFYYASLVNGYIYFWNLPLNLKVVQINGLFAYLPDLSKTPCNDGSNESNTCFDMNATNFPIDEELTQTVYEGALRLLNLPLQLVADKTDDSNESIR